MAEQFIQGDAPYFLGLTLTSGNQVLTTLRDTLNNANWTITDNIATNNSFLAQGTYNVYDFFGQFLQTDSCWIKIRDDLAGNIIVNGDYAGNDSILSSDFLIPYSTTNSFRLFGCFNNGAGGFIIYNNQETTPQMEGCHLGFLQRAVLLDSDAIYIGNLSGDSWIDAECALDMHTNTINWKKMSDDYRNPANWTTSGSSQHPPLVEDYLTSAKPYSGDMDTTASLNVGYYNQHGKKNASTGQSIPVPYGISEGRGGNNTYGEAEILENKIIGQNIHLRGFVQYVRSGCRQELLGNRLIDRRNEELLLSKEVGGLALQIGRVKPVLAVLNTPIFVKSGLSQVISIYKETTIYIEGTDYTVNLTNSTVTFLSTGNIITNNIIMINYAL